MVTWQPKDVGTYFPDGYVAQTNRRSISCSVAGMDATTCTLTGLKVGVHYSVKVYATYQKPGVSGEFKGRSSAKVLFTLES